MIVLISLELQRLPFATLSDTSGIVSADVSRWLGSAGLGVAAGLAGFADTHAAAIYNCDSTRDARHDVP